MRKNFNQSTLFLSIYFELILISIIITMIIIILNFFKDTPSNSLKFNDIQRWILYLKTLCSYFFSALSVGVASCLLVSSLCFSINSTSSSTPRPCWTNQKQVNFLGIELENCELKLGTQWWWCCEVMSDHLRQLFLICVSECACVSHSKNMCVIIRTNMLCGWKAQRDLFIPVSINKTYFFGYVFFFLFFKYT